MKIAQISMDGYFNYGNILQKYALNRTLRRFADFVEVLWCDPTKFLPEDGHNYHQFVVKPSQNTMRITREAIRQSKFKDFENLYIPTRFYLPYVEEIADEYDFFVVGSDQIWHPNWLRLPKSLITFVPHEKKVAYAASVSALEIPNEKKEIFRRGVSDFKRVSVREEGSAEIIKELTGKSVPVLLDPIFLLSREEWLTISQKPTWFKEKYRHGYVLTYYLRKLPPLEVKIFAEKLDLPVINLLDLANYNHFTVGPAEFVWLFANASLIFTNSFHGVAFSILFKHPFINREISDDPNGISMSRRITGLLKLFGLENRRTFGDEKVFSPKDSLKIDFSRRDEVLPLERAKSFKFLAESLGVDPLIKLFGRDV